MQPNQGVFGPGGIWLRSQQQGIVGLKTGLKVFQGGCAAQTQAAAGCIRIIKVLRPVGSQQEGMRWTRLGQIELPSAHHDLGQQPDCLPARAGVSQISIQKKFIQGFSQGAHCRCDRAGSLVVGLAKFCQQLFLMRG